VAHRALVVGAGNAGKAHAEALASLGIDFAGPVSGIATAADPAAIRDRSIDVVHVATTNDLHAPLVGEALRAEKHVVCEKPLAAYIGEAEMLVRRADETDVRSTICQNYRFMPLLVELRARVLAGELGEVHLARGSFLQDWLLLVGDDDWRMDPQRGGGSRTVADIGVHWIDLVECLTGRTAESVVAQVGYLHGRRTEDHASLLIRFSGGLQGACVVSQASAGHRNEVELSLDGTKGSAMWRSTSRDELWLGARDESAKVIARAGARAPEARALARKRPLPDEGRRNLLAAFYGELDGTRSPVPLPTFADGLRHVRFAAAAIESSRTGEWVDLEKMQTTFTIAPR
jgi:predicted dehydrogenase